MACIRKFAILSAAGLGAWGSHAFAQSDAPVPAASAPSLAQPWQDRGLRAAEAGNRMEALACGRALVLENPALAATYFKQPAVARILYEGQPITTLEGDQIKFKRRPALPLAPPLLRNRGGQVIIELILDRDGLPLRAEALDGPRELRAAAESYCVQVVAQPPASGTLGRLLLVVPFASESGNTAAGMVSTNVPSEVPLEPGCRTKY